MHFQQKISLFDSLFIFYHYILAPSITINFVPYFSKRTDIAKQPSFIRFPTLLLYEISGKIFLQWVNQLLPTSTHKSPAKPETDRKEEKESMKTKKFLTANLKPGMVSAEAAYTYNNHLVIQSNTTLTPDIIDKLKYYAVKAVKIYITEDGEPDIAHENREISIVAPLLWILMALLILRGSSNPMNSLNLKRYLLHLSIFSNRNSMTLSSRTAQTL